MPSNLVANHVEVAGGRKFHTTKTNFMETMKGKVKSLLRITKPQPKPQPKNTKETSLCVCVGCRKLKGNVLHTYNITESNVQTV